MRFMRQQNEQAGRGGGGHPSPDQSPSRRSRISSNTGHVDNYYPREEQRTQPQYHDDHPQQHHGYQRGPAHDALKALQDYNKRMQGEFAPAWQPSASQYGGPDSSSLYPGNGGSGSGGGELIGLLEKLLALGSGGGRILRCSLRAGKQSSQRPLETSAAAI